VNFDANDELILDADSNFPIKAFETVAALKVTGYGNRSPKIGSFEHKL